MTSQEIRCPSCSRLLVLRAGPAITTHFAHRPRQSCRNRPGGSGVAPLRVEQLTLFELEPLAPRASADLPPAEVTMAPVPRPARRRRRRRAWLPRLIRRLKGRPRATVVPGR
jgi:hypothetical protein